MWKIEVEEHKYSFGPCQKTPAGEPHVRLNMENVCVCERERERERERNNFREP